MGCIFIGVFLMPGMVRRFGKKKVYIGGLLIWVAGDLLNYFFGGGSVSFVAFSCLAFFGSAFVNSLNWALVSDTVEYGEWRTGVRSEGTVYTGFTFFRKVSQALAGFFHWLDADANRLRPQRGAICEHGRRFAAAYLYLSVCPGSYHHRGNGLFLQSQRKDVCPHR